ncbi:Alpha-tocopherol transfer protein-like [Argiope bruennichi]|uniref:Alpha-tocopherol transfer protein-like n=1 Tax=Argiope bruennichi TaxID=94029 RepID=A0A8T0ESK4_ARGBR|nr:Alpha-tocopherol transfer protein-like [Argiope bruennichi]
MCSKVISNKSEDTLPFHTHSLPKFVIRKCEEELNETPGKKAKAVLELRSMLKNNPETSEYNFHDDLLVLFLRRNKYRMRDAFQNVQNFVNIHRKESYLFKSASDKYLDLPSCKGLVLLPKRCPDGCTIVRSQLGRWNPNEMPFEKLQSLFTILFLQLLRDPMTQINGFKIIHDFKGTSLHLKFLHSQSFANCVPGRYKEIHLVNESFVMKTLWAIVKPFLSEKIRNRVIFHSKPEGLLHYFPRSVLPAEYGGTLLNNDTEDWIKIANKYHKEYTVEGQPNFY